MKYDFFEALEALEKEKGIPKEYMLERVEAALLTAFKKQNSNEKNTRFNADDVKGGNDTNVRIAIDPEKKTIKTYKQMKVVEEVTDEKTEISLETAREKSKRAKVGDVLEYEFKPVNFDRIPAQTAKMVIIQGIREAERGKLIEEYEKKREGIIVGTVQIIEKNTGNVILEFEDTQATLMKNEQLPGDRFKVGDHVKVYVCEVKKETRNPIIVLSRTHPNFIKRLFESEVPEIQDGTVIIQSVAREAGSRTKIAVYSRDENVDPIGACIGVRGVRKASILKELAGEKIDIIKYSEYPGEYVAASLSPAVVSSVVVSDDKTCVATVAPDQLSLAIGKEGQNVRLAVKLCGYKIDIKAE